ncbi:uncharacterized protein G2W53_040100 [Senna tora]|uniref:Uncharacterized protein n=1 Tax=Senna tora TaxID=362788 RepID=A0A834SPW3_9FABA|nr:uncharacterized protein G2W53_040100 [Senna tora]
MGCITSGVAFAKREALGAI